MRWERFFDDLEEQLDAEWEAERAALDSEAERLRLSRLPLTERLRALTGPDAPDVAAALADGVTLTGRITAVGADWMGLERTAGRARSALVPLAAVRSLAMPERAVLAGLRGDAAARARELRERMTLGFAVRDLARRRVPVTAHLRGGAVLSGTVDRALHDHLDLAVHDAGAPRRRAGVTGLRIVPLGGVAWLQLHDDADGP